jgi:hypothetical protein
MARCRHCHRPFDPAPRAAGRQVTCGDPACQRRQHAEACERWRGANPDATAHHYGDVVVPFRARRTAYQREWRLLCSLREIRDAIAPAVRTVDRRLARVLARGDRLRDAPPRIGEALALAAALARQLAELSALIDRLPAAPGRDTRRD